jgi:TonB-linked SusC/RagA family outer membrane protein
MKKYLLAHVLVALCFLGAHAQSRVITGKVTSMEDGSSLPGVAVVLKGTQTGTSTDANGAYSITVTGASPVLQFSFLGFASQEIRVGERTIIDVQLETDIKELTEVVVTAQGIAQEKRALGYAVSTVKTELIENRPESDIGRVLQGKVPGVNITSTSGVSGTGTNIVIRGYSSVTGSNQPLFVVDGVPYNSGTNSQADYLNGGQTTSSRMLDLDPNSIESVSVLKGLSATVLYGDQGRNGVILVTTKAGKKQVKATEITLSQSYFQNTIASLPDYQNNYGGGFQQLTGDSWFFSNWGAHFNDVTEVPHPVGMSGVASIRNAFPEFAVNPSQPWGPATEATRANIVRYPNKAYSTIGESFFRKADIHNTSLQISGSSGSTGYSASFGYQNEGGFTPGNTVRRLNFGLGLNTSVTDKLSVQSSFQFSNTDMVTPPLNAGFGSNAANGIPSTYANVLYTPRNVDLANLPYENPNDRSSVYYRGSNDITNPLWLVRYYSNTSNVNRFFNSSSINYDFNENFSLVYRIGLDTYTDEQELKYNKGGTGNNPNIIGGMYQSVSIKNTIWNQDLILNYRKQLSEKFSLSALLGANNRYDSYEQFGVSSSGQVAFGLFNHSNFETSSSRNVLTGEPLNYFEEQRRLGVYTSATLEYMDYLYLNVLARNDWTSTVEPDNRRILYPGASVSFIPTSAFDLAPNVLDFMKLRLGFGTSAGFPDPYSTRNFLVQNTRAFSSSANTFISQSISTLLGNSALKPELQQEWEFGVESTMFGGKLRFDLSLYQRTTKDLITGAPIDPSTGFTLTAINIGDLETKGIDLSATVTPVRMANGFTWDATINFGRYRSIITSLGTDLEEVLIAGDTDIGNFAIAGKPYGIIKGIGIEKHENGQKIVLENGRYKETSEIVELGDPNPEFTSSLINNLSYKNFRLSFMFEYRHGGVIVSNTVKGVLARGLSTDTDQLDRALTLILPGVREDGSPNTTQVTASNYFFDNYFFSDEAITFDGSTARLREVSLSYLLPKSLVSKTPFRAASITLTGSNLWFRALNMPKGVNFDTDVLSTGVGNGLGFDYLTGPSARRFGGTLSLTF